MAHRGDGRARGEPRGVHTSLARSNLAFPAGLTAGAIDHEDRPTTADDAETVNRLQEDQEAAERDKGEPGKGRRRPALTQREHLRSVHFRRDREWLQV